MCKRFRGYRLLYTLVWVDIAGLHGWSGKFISLDMQIDEFHVGCRSVSLVFNAGVCSSVRRFMCLFRFGIKFEVELKMEIELHLRLDLKIEPKIEPFRL